MKKLIKKLFFNKYKNSLNKDLKNFIHIQSSNIFDIFNQIHLSDIKELSYFDFVDFNNFKINYNFSYCLFLRNNKLAYIAKFDKIKILSKVVDIYGFPVDIPHILFDYERIILLPKKYKIDYFDNLLQNF